MNHISSLKLQRQKVLHEQIREQIRDLILSGRLTPGEQIPSTERLATMLETHVPTVHLAMTNLVKEGLLVRQQGKGTFVRERAARLQCVATYYGEESLGQGRSLYIQSLHAAIQTALQARKIETRVWIDPRPSERRDTPWAPFARAAANREFQGAIVPGAGDKQTGWLRKLSVPVAFANTADVPNRVNADMKAFADLSVGALADQGCGSIGLIAPMSTEVEPTVRYRPYLDFLERFNDLGSDLGLRVRNQWVRVQRRGDPRRISSHEAYGYEQFRELWRQPERPEGVVVLDDVTARGVITALLELSVQVPAELRLVLHKNEGIDLLCPVPASFVVTSEQATARALIEQVEKQFRGEVCEPIILPPRLEPAPRASNKQNRRTAATAKGETR